MDEHKLIWTRMSKHEKVYAWNKSRPPTMLVRFFICYNEIEYKPLCQ